jgi:Lon protease-like protein
VTSAVVSLFPLSTVLFPDGPLPLRIFEPRYLDLVSNCLKNDAEFGVVLIRSGTDTGDVEMSSVGTLARIIDWYQGSDGILGITARGTRRFRLLRTSRQADGLYVGDIELLPEFLRQELPGRFEALARLLAGVIGDLGRLYEAVEKRYDDAEWVGCRLAEIVPMSLAEKQHCLELSDPVERLEFLRPMLRPLRDKPQ